ncbi:decaprenylphospho-beta-D-erythro-pentofuranosid-2-ulose 2-reductase [Modestobacter sp. I12A-02628]|uniref:Decaprenylphospho-beta-D-erythro-pentofuranosid-2-ulose 2-reductase n=1 Tax=Goekera deserti TaxID=2497753 RepID=A0A7K3W829_9ACTN|nr:decaprenylphospho-beta-D-erythro-pentofuranosid-2-ulose 2-reductase [Goekera deserti]MPR00334.1 decaprenylphospho-beta-D-erythro-pentofuranosid-2-ulose 2-reductase [Goekera deserti]NDI49508.1 decaprenylphospho-beta-D-erythro-pentofuranosid-2-ulose 2-reductase [Goekera deserti]NEL52618.1 decaprenylphospho-beta-D-erythro-pentofuranosid-2-ulose 2-reductase [Goekera deserti]
MIDALGSVGSLLLVGGTSDIAAATAHRYLAERPLRVVVAARDTPRRAAVAAELAAAGATVQVVDFDADDPASPARMVAEAAAGGDVDVAVVAFGQLGDQQQLAADPDAVAALARVNYVAPAVVGTVLAQHMRAQGHGVIVALSSVAGERPRASNFVYGSTKAGIDAFYSGLGDSLAGTGVSVLVVRPGFVRSKMTEGLDDAPLATTPQAVAEAIVAGVRSGRHTVWVPGAMRVVMSGLRHVPRALFRRLPI